MYSSSSAPGNEPEQRSYDHGDGRAESSHVRLERAIGRVECERDHERDAGHEEEHAHCRGEREYHELERRPAEH
jgi:hypothetical protein